MESNDQFFVTGGAGFLGSHVVDRLVESGFSVTVIDDLSTGRRNNVHSQATFVHKACDAIRATDFAPGSTIIHCAARPRCNSSVFAPLAEAQTNYLAGLHVLKAAMDADVQRLVIVSSMSVYGDCDLPYRESMLPRPRDPYAINKWAFEQVVKVECSLVGMDYVILRPQHVFGARQRADLGYRNVIAKWIRRALHDHPLPVFGDLSLTRAFSPVSLIARGVVAASRHPSAAGQTLNLGSGTVRSLREIAEIISGATGKLIRFETHPAPPTLVLQAFGDVSKARELLGVKEEDGEFDRNLTALVAELSAAPDTGEMQLEPEVGEPLYRKIYG